MEGKAVEESRTFMSQLMMPTDANPAGNVHGGTIMKLVDTAGGICATRHARRPVVTVVMDTMTFLQPVYVGHLVRLEAQVNWVGRTSLEVGVKVTAENVLTGDITHTSSAYLVYVALDEAGQPTPVPRLILQTDEERRRWEAAEARRERRLREKAAQEDSSR
ncbi:MAG: acyl-CoA thioesterase [Chloroflexi bacterium]|nr:MAG: acyl-CoA thioesterase [Chloroflexota bacterium]